jgi:putative cell wall-binding protein
MRANRGRTAASLIVLTLLASVLAAPGTALADTDWLDAQTPVDAALAWSRFVYADGSAAHAVLGRDDVFADNLTSGLIQGVHEAPLLLTASHRLDRDVATELARLGVQTVHVLGGVKAISAAVTDELHSLGFTTRRLEGGSRIETAIAIARAYTTTPTAAILARAFSDGSDESRGFADSLASGAWAAEEGYPILLTPTATVPGSVIDYLRSSTITRVFIVGGAAAIGSGIEAELRALGYQVTRIAGTSRVETALAIATERRIPTARQAERVVLVEGQSPHAWAGGFAAAGYAAARGAIVLTTGGALPDATRAFLEAGSAPLVCAPFIDAGICDEAAVALGQAGGSSGTLPSSGITITPTQRVFTSVSVSSGSGGATLGQRVFTATVAAGIATVNIALFPTANLTIGGGQVTFAESPAGQAAGLAQTIGAITHVNGVDVTDARIQTNVTVPDNREVTFTINAFGSIEAGDVTPVVYVPTSSVDTALPTSGGRPVKSYGLGGSTRWLPQQGANGDSSLGAVAEVDRTNKYVITGEAEAARTYYWDANDTYRINSEQVTMLEFEQRLAANERLTKSNYQQDRAKVSIFDITTNYPTPPTVSASTPGAEATVRVSVTPGLPTYDQMVTSDKFRILRAARTAGNSCDATATYAATWTQVAERSKSQDVTSGSPFVYSDTNVPAGCWRYAATVVSGSDVSEVATTYGYAQIGLISTNTSVTDSAPVNGILETGDFFTVTFDKAPSIAAGTVLTLADDDGTRMSLSCGTNAACSASGQSITVTVTGAPELIAPGSSAGLAITGGSTSIVSVTGAPNALQAWNLAESGRFIASRKRVFGTANPTNSVLASAPGGMSVASGVNSLITIAGSNEIQTIPALTGATEGTTFTLAIDTTVLNVGPLSYDADANTIRDAFATAYGSQVVTVSGGPIHQAAVQLQFIGDLAGQNVGLFVIDTDTLNISPPVVLETQPGVDLVNLAPGDVVQVFDVHGLALGPPRTIAVNTTPNFNTISLTRALSPGDAVNIVAIKGDGRPSQTLRTTAS